MKLTLLQAINFYADHTDSFRVSTIDDSVESQQAASIAEKVFHDLNNDVFGNMSLETLIQLEALADSTKPNYLRLPDEAADIRHDVIMYDISDDPSEIESREVEYITPLAFLDRQGLIKSSSTNQIITDFSGYRYRIENDTAPKLYTSFDDEHLVFDSFDSSVDSTLQSSKSGIITQLQRTFTQSDTYIIDFPEWFHTTYLNVFMSECSAALREEPLPTIARLARLGVIRARKKNRVGQRITAKDYGRH